MTLVCFVLLLNVYISFDLILSISLFTPGLNLIF